MIQHDLNESEIKNLALYLMKIHGTEKTESWTFRIGRTISAVALCRWDISRIEFSRHFIHRISMDGLKEAILHEIAHVIVGPYSELHGKEWQEIMRGFGYPDASPYIQVFSIPEYRYGLFDGEELVKGFYRRPRPSTIEATMPQLEFRKIG
jgi:predicted SprT family Zn-dependent metalloprotease